MTTYRCDARDCDVSEESTNGPPVGWERDDLSFLCPKHCPSEKACCLTMTAALRRSSWFLVFAFCPFCMARIKGATK
jgi:hypothetical protein